MFGVGWGGKINGMGKRIWSLEHQRVSLFAIWRLRKRILLDNRGVCGISLWESQKNRCMVVTFLRILQDIER